MGFRYSGNIPKERQIFNATALSGIEYAINALLRDTNIQDSFTERIGKSILAEEDILVMGKVFRSLLQGAPLEHKIHLNVNTLIIHRTQLIPVILSAIKHLQSAGWAYKGQSEELNRASNQVTLVLNLIKGLDPSLRVYAYADALFAAVWNYYFTDTKIYY